MEESATKLIDLLRETLGTLGGAVEIAMADIVKGIQASVDVKVKK